MISRPSSRVSLRSVRGCQKFRVSSINSALARTGAHGTAETNGSGAARLRLFLRFEVRREGTGRHLSGRDAWRGVFFSRPLYELSLLLHAVRQPRHFQA